MGYDLPAAIGAAFSSEGRRVICMAGDGSIQLNIQELQTIVHHQLPIKIFVMNNGGYLSIRTTQKSFFGGNFVGEGPRSGVSFPDWFGLRTHMESRQGRSRSSIAATVSRKFWRRRAPISAK